MVVGKSLNVPSEMFDTVKKKVLKKIIFV